MNAAGSGQGGVRMRDLADVAVVFDLDGTLVDSRLDFAALRAEVHGLLAAAGMPWTGARHDEPALAELLTWARTRGGDGAGSPYDRALRLVQAAERAGERAQAMDGARALLSSLREGGAALAVLTNNAREGSLRQLDRLGLRRAVDAVFSRDDVPAMKPDPRGLAMALAVLGKRPRRWFVGDSWIDAAAAQALGVPFLALHLTPQALREHGLEIPAGHIEHLAQVEGAVREAAST